MARRDGDAKGEGEASAAKAHGARSSGRLACRVGGSRPRARRRTREQSSRVRTVAQQTKRADHRVHQKPRPSLRHERGRHRVRTRGSSRVARGRHCDEHGIVTTTGGGQSRGEIAQKSFTFQQPERRAPRASRRSRDVRIDRSFHLFSQSLFPAFGAGATTALTSIVSPIARSAIPSPKNM